MLTASRESHFEDLVAEVSSCRTCARMDGCVRVLSWANGNIKAPLMFIGEAPGRFGADRTAIPFHGDKAGDNFEALLETAGISRKDIFVTNAVLCNPRDERGNNAPPNRSEITNCAGHLRQQIELVNPSLVMTLGTVALEATKLIENHDLTLRGSVRTSNHWYNRLLLPLYHPGARALIHRSFHNQVSDYYHIQETLKRINQQKKQRKPREDKDNSWDIVENILRKNNEISLFRLHKLLYLIDIFSINKNGSPLTSFFYIRQKDGPYCVDLGSRWYNRYAGKMTVRKNPNISLRWNETMLFEPHQSQISEETLSLIDEVVLSTKHLDDAKLKTKVYLTAPMKRFLEMEKRGMSALNRPLF